MINELARFANSEQALIAVFTAVFCFTHAEHNLFKLNLNYIIIESVQAVNCVLCEFKETNQICSPLKISQSMNAESACDGNNKSMYSCFYESKKLLSCLIIERKKNRR